MGFEGITEKNPEMMPGQDVEGEAQEDLGESGEGFSVETDSWETEEAALHHEDVPEGMAFQDAPPESRSVESIMRDIQEAQRECDYNSRRYAALLSKDPGQQAGLNHYGSAAKSWGYRLEKLQEELRDCPDRIAAQEIGEEKGYLELSEEELDRIREASRQIVQAVPADINPSSLTCTGCVGEHVGGCTGCVGSNTGTGIASGGIKF